MNNDIQEQCKLLVEYLAYNYKQKHDYKDSYKYLASQYGLAYSSLKQKVSKYRREHGIKSNYRYTDKQKQTIINLYKKGISIVNIAKRIDKDGMSSGIINFLKREGIYKKTRVYRRYNYKKLMPQILSLLKDGKTVAEISKALNIRYNNLYCYLWRKGYVGKNKGVV